MNRDKQRDEEKKKQVYGLLKFFPSHRTPRSCALLASAQLTSWYSASSFFGSKLFFIGSRAYYPSFKFLWRQ